MNLQDLDQITERPEKEKQLQVLRDEALRTEYDKVGCVRLCFSDFADLAQPVAGALDL